MLHPIFISYARNASRAQAEALHQALGGSTGLAFLDTSGLELGERFPPKLAEALLAARVVVVFATKEYFRRWYCLWEFEAALGPFLALGPGASSEEKATALAPLVVALPTQASTAKDLLHLPPVLRVTGWPQADELAALEQLVRTRLGTTASTMGDRLQSAGRLGAALRTRLLEESVLPPPKNLADARMYPRALPPSLGDSFVGRADELWRIHYTLSVLRDRRGEGASGAALTGALHGAGGFGKTRLALEYLHRLGPSEHPGGVFWVNADAEQGSLEEQFHGILRTLRPEVPDLVKFRESKRDASREMAEALEAMAATERVLYVVDNVPEPSPQEKPRLLTTWCPALGKVSLLATSRARLDLGVDGIHALPLSPLTPETAVALLTEGISPGNVNEAGWLHVAEWVGYLPLALEVLNRALRAGVLEPEELLERVKAQGPTRELDRQMEVLRRHVSPGALRGVTEAFSLSYERLSKPEQRAARLIAHCAPEPVPLKLFEALGPEVASAGIRATLRSRHFVIPVEAAGEVAMFGTMHRLLADYLRGQSSQPLDELRQVCQGLVKIMHPSACEDPRAWPLLKACLSHAQSVFDRLMESARPFNAMASSEWSKNVEINLGFALGRFLSARGLVSQAYRIHEQTFKLTRATLGEDHPDTLTAIGNLALTLWAQGDWAGARELEQGVLKEMRRVLGEEHPATLTAMGNLAATLRAQGDWAGARKLEQGVLEGRRRVLGVDHPDTLKAMGNLALTLRAQGDWVGARELLQAALEGMCRVLGEEHPHTLIAKRNLALALRATQAKQKQGLKGRVLNLIRSLLGKKPQPPQIR